MGKIRAIKKYRLNPDKLEEMKYYIACAEGKVIPIEKHNQKVAVLHKEINRLRSKLQKEVIELEEKLNTCHRKLMKV